MDLTQLANLGEFIGGVAVVASLIYVGFQIRQNTDSVRMTAEFDSSRSFSDWLSRVSLSDDQARIFERGVWDHEQLDENEKLRFLWAIADVFSRIEGFYRLHQRGYLPSDAYQPWEAALLGYLNSDLVMRWWRAGAMPYLIGFREYVEQLLRSGATTDTFKAFGKL